MFFPFKCIEYDKRFHCNLNEFFNFKTKLTKWIRPPLSLKCKLAVVKIAVFLALSWVIFLS